MYLLSCRGASKFPDSWTRFRAPDFQTGSQARAINSEAVQKLDAATGEFKEAEGVRNGLVRKINGLETDAAETKAELDKTFFLNFGKKGELKDIIKGLDKEIKAQSKSLEKAEKTSDKASNQLQKVEQQALKERERADKILADARSASDKVTAAAEKKSSSIVDGAEKKAESITKQAEGKANGLIKQADQSEKQAEKLRAAM